MKARMFRSLVFAAAVSPLGAAALKAPAALPLDSAAADLGSMRALLLVEGAQTNELRRVMEGFAVQTHRDRQAVEDRQSLIQLARDRQRRLIESLREICDSNQRARVKVLEALWDRLDGDVIWVLERCGLSEAQGIRVGGILADFRESRGGGGAGGKGSPNHPGPVSVGFPTGRANTQIENLLTPAQRSLYRELRQEQDQALAAAAERASTRGSGEGRGPGGGHGGGDGMHGGGMPGGGFPGGGRSGGY